MTTDGLDVQRFFPSHHTVSVKPAVETCDMTNEAHTATRKPIDDPVLTKLNLHEFSWCPTVKRERSGKRIARTVVWTRKKSVCVNVRSETKLNTHAGTTQPNERVGQRGASTAQGKSNDL